MSDVSTVKEWFQQHKSVLKVICEETDADYAEAVTILAMLQLNENIKALGDTMAGLVVILEQQEDDIY